ncbi:MAG: Na+/H+ antiporter subunit E [Balneolaceae bacterium]|nr:Na+/H+ antiporter subunit E [Balneolaceae bacterium]
MSKFSFFSITLSFISLMLFWIAMSGFRDAIHLTFGVLSVGGVLMLNYQLKKHRFYTDDMDNLDELRLFRAAYYFIWLIYQIIIAGFHVLGIILRPSMPIEPSIIKFSVDLPSSHAKMILGNSITLTPGTLTIDIEGDLFIVHSLDDASFESLKNDEMPRQVLQLFDKEDRSVIRDFEIIKSAEEI